jgi:hypothetical protein
MVSVQHFRRRLCPFWSNSLGVCPEEWKKKAPNASVMLTISLAWIWTWRNVLKCYQCINLESSWRCGTHLWGLQYSCRSNGDVSLLVEEYFPSTRVNWGKVMNRRKGVGIIFQDAGLLVCSPTCWRRAVLIYCDKNLIIRLTARLIWGGRAKTVYYAVRTVLVKGGTCCGQHKKQADSSLH